MEAQDQTTFREMPKYRSHKTVWALQIEAVSDSGTDSTTEENQLVTVSFKDPRFAPRTINIGHKPVPEPGWYMVVYGSGYVSFSPAKEFEEGNTPADAANGSYEWALGLVKRGHMLARRGWNGKEMFIFLVPGSKFNVNRAPLLGIFPEGTEITYRPHIDMRTADGQIVPWVASQSDQLVDDWYIVR